MLQNYYNELKQLWCANKENLEQNKIWQTAVNKWEKANAKSFSIDKNSSILIIVFLGILFCAEVC